MNSFIELTLDNFLPLSLAYKLAVSVEKLNNFTQYLSQKDNIYFVSGRQSVSS